MKFLLSTKFTNASLNVALLLLRLAFAGLMIPHGYSKLVRFGGMREKFMNFLGMGSTLPEHRRKGAQGALMARRIRDAAKLGCEWVCTETGEDTPQRPNPSYHNMIRTGFEFAYLRPTWVYQAKSQIC